MNLIQQALRAAVPLFAMAAMVAAAPASAGADGHERARADFRSCAKPVYPAGALKDKRTGTVSLGFLVDADGKLVSSKVNESSGHPDLDDAALEGIKLCKFEAATQDGKPVKEWMQVRYVWTLQ